MRGWFLGYALGLVLVGGVARADIDRTRYSLSADWGAALVSPDDTNSSSPPLFLGGTVSIWTSNWFLVDASYDYIFRDARQNLLVGPRLRFGLLPLAFSAGIQGGAIFLPASQVRFGISPNAGVDLLATDHILLAVHYNLDVPVGSGADVHRLFMRVGYRW